MAQFYFLSVLLNIIAGLILVYGLDFTKEVPSGEKKSSSKKKETSSSTDKKKKENTVFSGAMKSFERFDSKAFRLVIGVLSAFVGVMKLLSVFRNDIPVIGDLFPALAGIAASFSLLLEYFMVSSTEEQHVPELLEKIFIGSRKYIGMGCIIVALLHFVFPQVMLL